MKRLFLTAAVFFFCVSTFAQDNVLENVERIGRVMVHIHNDYIDTVNFDAVADASIREIIGKLDPHSVFIPKEEVESTNEPLEGSFEGIGIEFAVINDTISVQAVISGGASESVGLMAGDKIVEVDGENVTGIGITTDGVRKRLRGAGGTKVNLKVVRRDVDEKLEYTITRGKIPLTSIDAAYCPEPGIIYVKLSRFALTSAVEFLDAFDLVEELPDGIILDLRGNGGGYLHVATLMANFLLEKGSLILYTEGRNSPMREEYANGGNIYPRGPLVVLVDENSASASEILAGAVQDWDRGVIIGRRSFGKGLVQHQYTLSDGSQIRLTVARYHTPCGRVIQSPYEEGHRAEYYDKLNERYLHGEMFCKDSIVFPDSLKYQTLKLKRTIYGGGGIMPDIFVPSDTTGVNDFFSSVIRRGVLTDYANSFCDRHRSEIAVEGRSFEEFYDYYNNVMEAEAYSGLLEYCSERGVTGDSTGCEKLLKTRLKALVAKTAFDTTGYYRVINIEDDPEFQAAMKVIRQWNEDGKVTF